MELTQKDYDERKARVDAGQGDDEDARLVKHYESQGFSPDANSAGKRQETGSEVEGTVRHETGSGADIEAAPKPAKATVRGARNQG